MKQILKSIKSLFSKGLVSDIELNKKVRQSMLIFFDDYNHGDHKSVLKTITKLDVTHDISNNSLKLNIESHCPALLIGKAGKDIDALKEFLSRLLGHNIEVNLTECKMWQDCWK